MTLKEIIKRRIVLKEQHIFIIRREIQALESDLHKMVDEAVAVQDGSTNAQPDREVKA